MLFDTVITNVPLPGIPLTMAGARLDEIYPIVPLAPHHLVGIAISPYRDNIHIGLQANGEAVDDLGSLTDAITKSMAEFTDTLLQTRHRVARIPVRLSLVAIFS